MPTRNVNPGDKRHRTKTVPAIIPDPNIPVVKDPEEVNIIDFQSVFDFDLREPVLTDLEFDHELLTSRNPQFNPVQKRFILCCAEVAMPHHNIAKALGLKTDQFLALLDEDHKLRSLYGSVYQDATLRLAQEAHRMAMDGNTTMMALLLKQRLGLNGDGSPSAGHTSITQIRVDAESVQIGGEMGMDEARRNFAAIRDGTAVLKK